MTSSSRSTYKVTTLDYILAALFLVFAIVQYNDPDGLLWGVVYLIIAAVCVLYKKLPKVVMNGIVVVFTIAFITYVPSLFNWIKDGMPSVVESMKAESPYIEMVREAGGLLIGLIVLVYLRRKVIHNYKI